MVILGWCMFYTYQFIAHPLPTSSVASEAIFYAFASESAWPVLTEAIAISLTALILLKSVKTIERANLVLAPTLILLLVVIFVWSMTRPGSGDGLQFMFSPDWDTLKSPLLWVDAATQNAFDTGAGTGIFVAYAAYMAKDTPVVKYAFFIPIMNNVVSLISGMLIFSTVFSTSREQNPNITDVEILDLLRETGPGSTGLTFIWLPVLLDTAGTFGRVIAVTFFLCLVCAALSSAIAILEMITHAFDDFGMPRIASVLSATTATFILGLGSALNLEYLTNQDFTWGLALLLNGMLLQYLVIRFGVATYRDTVINGFSKTDWKINISWDIMVKFIAPFEAVLLLGWYFVSEIIDTEDGAWYQLRSESLLTLIIQWACTLIILLSINFIVLKLVPAAVIKTYELMISSDNLDDATAAATKKEDDA
ncbi:hypothetical protein CAPTEDRAFT_229243 [Capitella teleta]|uniref:Sodium-dependent transporter n=1 Tax=Capitella teleta TaxID=283909 RepID=R7V3Y7_CAPTE|nr:hypothetical protein CAPTEDRAFT_229243 [Capitella teleta]|eukprot:ELU13568.1 hypothetical protein CAPTEDRAFT_229243 [Capitella teleta]